MKNEDDAEEAVEVEKSGALSPNLQLQLHVIDYDRSEGQDSLRALR